MRGLNLRVFFGLVAEPLADVEPAGVLGFVTTRRTGRGSGARLLPTVLGEQNSGFD